MFKHRWGCQAGIGATQGFRNPGVLSRGAFDVYFVQYRFGPRSCWCCVSGPVEVFGNNAGLQPVKVASARPVGKNAGEFTGVGVKQQAFRIEPMSRPVRAVNTVGIAQAGPALG